MARLFFLLSFLVSNLFLASCAVNPVTGASEFSLLSRQDEISIGNEQYGPSQQSQGGEYKVDPELSAYVNEEADAAAIDVAGLPPPPPPQALKPSITTKGLKHWANSQKVILPLVIIEFRGFISVIDSRESLV